MFQDYLFFGADTHMRYCFRMAHVSGLVAEAQRRHALSPVRTELLGAVVTSCILLSSLLQDDERVNLRVQLGDDIIISAETTCFGEVKAYIRCNEGSQFVKDVDAGMPWLARIMVRSIRSRKDSGSLFEGVTETQASSMELAINDHLESSFQMAAGMRVQAWTDADGSPRAFGAVFMELPEAPKDASERMWTHVGKLPPMKSLLAEGDDPDRIAAALIPDSVRAIKSLSPIWKCTCSEDGVLSALRGIAARDPAAASTFEQEIEVRCEYCAQVYRLARERVLANLLEAAKPTHTPC